MTAGEEWTERCRALKALYRDLDEAVRGKGWQCRGCGVCCHFDVVDHVLYISDLERRCLAALPPPATPDADDELLGRGLRCPYQKDNLCLARDNRPLGCRLHFCDADDANDMLFYEEWHTRLKTLHDELGIPWRYGPAFPL